MLQPPQSASEIQKQKRHWRELIHHLVHKRDYHVIVKEDVVVLSSPDGSSAYTLPRELYEDTSDRRSAA